MHTRLKSFQKTLLAASLLLFTYAASAEQCIYFKDYEASGSKAVVIRYQHLNDESIEEIKLWIKGSADEKNKYRNCWKAEEKTLIYISWLENSPTDLCKKEKDNVLGGNSIANRHWTVEREFILAKSFTDCIWE